jgi:hypothetical protein
MVSDCPGMPWGLRWRVERGFKKKQLAGYMSDKGLDKGFISLAAFPTFSLKRAHLQCRRRVTFGIDHNTDARQPFLGPFRFQSVSVA